MSELKIRRGETMIIESFASHLIKSAKEVGTSDIHILPEKEHFGIYFRLNGRMEQQYTVAEDDGNRLISYLKYSANMDVGERRRPQSGSFVYKGEESLNQDLRLSTLTNYHSQESLVIRLLELQEDVAQEKSTFLPEGLEKIKRLIHYKSGLILFSGPVNSGKTTTMYQLVRERMEQMKIQVIAIEDPVEIEEESFLQIQVNERAGNTYEASLKASLRHHPDVIIVGEIRDEETAKMAIRGALTGHLIIASVHAKNAEGVLARMHELGISYDMLNQTLIAVVFQKLLPIYCGLCGGDCKLYCSAYPVNQKRAALYDILESQQIHNLAVKNNRQDEVVRKSNFNHLLEKVLMYGFISETTYAQYYIP